MTEPIQLHTSEEWRIATCNPRFEVSSLGRVRNRRTRKVRKLQTMSSGYVYLLMFNGIKYVIHFVHVLVAEAFLGPRPFGLEVNHKDLNKGNNTPGNLEYVTHQQNIDHAKNAGVCPKGEMAVHSKLTIDQVIAIRLDYMPNHPTRNGALLARKYGISDTALRSIIARRTWKHV